MELTSFSGKKLQVSPAIFQSEFNETLVHQAITAYMAAARQGTKSQKTRREVSGGGIKPFKQKGTGRARAGSIRSPLWRGGGKVFAAKNRDYAQKLNKKMYRAAMRSVFAELNRQKRLILVEEFQVSTAKTSDFIKLLDSLDVKGSALVVTEAVDFSLYLAARNVRTAEVRDSGSIDPVSLVSFEQVVITVAALRQLEEVFG